MNAKLFQIRLLKRVLKRRKKGVLDRDSHRNPDSRTCECKALSERDSCVCILKMRAEAMHKRMGQSARADCAVGAKYYLAVRRSWSWLGRRLQCMWMHVVQITIPITFWIAIRNVFRNVILAHVNTAHVDTHDRLTWTPSTSKQSKKSPIKRLKIIIPAWSQEGGSFPCTGLIAPTQRSSSLKAYWILKVHCKVERKNIKKFKFKSQNTKISVWK